MFVTDFQVANAGVVEVERGRQVWRVHRPDPSLRGAGSEAGTEKTTAASQVPIRQKNKNNFANKGSDPSKAAN